LAEAREAVSGKGGFVGGYPMGVTETGVTVVVMAPVLAVCRYLADIVNIARCLPGVRSVRAGEAQTLTVRYGEAGARPARIVPGRFRIDQQGQLVEWEIRSAVSYSGTIRVYGDGSISQLQSVLRSDQPSLSGSAADLHVEMMRRIVRAVEAGIDPISIPAAAQLSGMSAYEPDHHPGDSPAVLHQQQMVGGR
jgi:hypothetical protein